MNKKPLDKKRFTVKIDPIDSELVDVMYGAGFTNLNLEYEVDNLSNKAVKKVLLKRFNSESFGESETMQEFDKLINMISFEASIAAIVEDDGYFCCENPYWDLVVIDRSHKFTAADLEDIYQQNEYALLGTDIVVNDVKVSDIPLHDYKKILNADSSNDWDWTEKAVKELLKRYKLDLKTRNTERLEALNEVARMVGSGELALMFDKNPKLSKEVSLTGENVIFIDDPLSVLRLPDSYQISRPSIMLSGKTSIHKDDDTFTDFDTINHNSVIFSEKHIIFTGDYNNCFNIDGAEIESKRIFVIKNKKEYENHLMASKSKKHIDMLISVYGSSQFVGDELMCDYCCEINTVKPEHHSFTCKNCGEENQ